MTNPTFERLQTLFRKVFRQSEMTITADSSSSNVKGWDSLKHIQLVVMIENEFKVKFKTKELIGLRNVGEMATLIEQKLNS